jgi:hypothetical protein
MKKVFAVFLPALIIALTLAGCGADIDRDRPVFETADISKVSLKANFISNPDDWIEVPSDDLPAIIDWLGTFRVGEKAKKELIPGSNSVRVRIKYSDGTVAENGLTTIKMGENTYYMTSENAPDAYLRILNRS